MKQEEKIIDAAEVMKWHDWYRQRVGTKPEPAEMTDKEILDFLDEYCDMMQQIPETGVTAARVVVDVYGVQTVKCRTLREAVCLAKAYFDEANRDH